ncbi:MAG: nicotinamide-nucleotide amidohydrolase family protein [Candidatus Aegiribacteria sp.]|nr:nicotinamide-nucleotide amidohydrolase family protein [Candidatus Aegiribacteria sp.]
MGLSEMELVKRIGSIMLKAGTTLSSAESCTGGMVAMLLTSIPGSSEWFMGGVTAYSNVLKTGVLNVPASLIESEGAVSRDTAVAMAAGIRKLTGSDFSISVTGIAGPGGGSSEKPVGTVCMAVCSSRSVSAEMKMFTGDRDVVRRKAADYLLAKLYCLLEKEVN